MTIRCRRDPATLATLLLELPTPAIVSFAGLALLKPNLATLPNHASLRALVFCGKKHPVYRRLLFQAVSRVTVKLSCNALTALGATFGAVKSGNSVSVQTSAA